MSAMSSRKTSNASSTAPVQANNQTADEVNPNKKYFTAYVFATSMSICASVIIGFLAASKDGFRWRTTYEDGNSAAKMFAFHPLFATIALIFLNSQASLFWRTLRYKKFSRATIKIFHAGAQLGVFVLLIFALHAVFVSHKFAGKPNVDEAHSWLGIIVVCMLLLQLIFGFGAFLFPGASRQTRLWYLNYHRFFGIVITLLSCIVVCMGMALYQSYGWGIQGILSKVYVIAVILYAFSIGYVFSNNEFQSPLGQASEDKSIYAEINGQNQYS